MAPRGQTKGFTEEPEFPLVLDGSVGVDVCPNKCSVFLTPKPVPWARAEADVETTRKRGENANKYVGWPVNEESKAKGCL